jgi:hypothetical protein
MEAYVTPEGVLIPKELFNAEPGDRVIVRKVYDYIVVRKISHPVERFAEAMEEIGKNMNYEDVKTMRRESERKITERKLSSK